MSRGKGEAATRDLNRSSPFSPVKKGMILSSVCVGGEKEMVAEL